jgi:hypothetical protein
VSIGCATFLKFANYWWLYKLEKLKDLGVVAASVPFCSAGPAI